MGDAAWAVLLGHDLSIERAVVASGPELGVANPEYEPVTEVKGLVQPLGATARAGLLGLYPESTHVVYVEGSEPEVTAGDLVVRLSAEGALAEATEAGAELIAALCGVTLVAGDEVEIGEGDQREVRRVVDVAEEGVELDRPLAGAHEAGSRVALRQRYEVLGAEDEAGRGHHWRVVVRRVW